MIFINRKPVLGKKLVVNVAEQSHFSSWILHNTNILCVVGSINSDVIDCAAVSYLI